MATCKEWKRILSAGRCDEQFSWLYQTRQPLECRARYLALLEEFIERYGEREVSLFSAPGRTELCGNHTDHQHGKVLAAAVTMDKIAVVAKEPEGPVSVWSEDHPVEGIDWRDHSPNAAETGHSPSLIRGVAVGLSRQGIPLGGFCSVTHSNVPSGSGLSSSAAFEILLGTIFSELYSGGKVSPEVLAAIGQYAENEYFGKPCGRMDQLACAIGGAVLMDLNDPEQVGITSLPCAFDRWGYALYVINAGGSHADLKADYAAVPAEMKLVAAAFGKEFLREVEPAEFYAAIGSLRKSLPDRALLRAMHFFSEEERVPRMAQAIRQGDAAAYCREMTASGRSSFCLLQNIYPDGNPAERSVALALALCEKLLDGCGAWRVHGGGFAGTVQALVPLAAEQEFCRVMREAFGDNACIRLHIRPTGGYMLKYTE